MFKPVLIRAGVALIFGLTTVFVQQPGTMWMKIALALYLVFSGSAMWEYLRREPVPEAMRSPLSMAAAAWMLGTIVLFFFSSPQGVGLTVATALLLGGIAELVAWFRHRRDFAPARDQLITGAVGVGSGIGLFFGSGLNQHSQLGIVGGGALILGVMLAVSGVGMFLDVRKAAKTDA
ncbi:hypothetical protein CEQ11_000580 [Micrococcus sp. FDAARGOS_333]|nr:hypothetical protein CEQ11_000580 [Micrococcus sp. FDAARGOS_333]